MTELEKFIEMSRYAGERYDLVQAGGGNTSVKISGDQMLIKASGYLLSEVNETKGYATVRYKEVLNILSNKEILDIADKRERDAKTSEAVTATVVGESARPSIETFLHGLLSKYTLHVHSIAVNLLTTRPDWKERCLEIAEDVLLIRYETPGLELALEMKKELDAYVARFGKRPEVICMQNHGLIITSDSFASIRPLTDQVVEKAEELAGIDFKEYRNTSLLSDLVNEIADTRLMTSLCTDAYLNQIVTARKDLFLEKPFCPDGFVYCGYKALDLAELSKEAILAYKKEHHELPKIVLYQNRVYVITSDLKKAKMIEDVLKNNILILEKLRGNITYLDNKEVSYLGNWEAEKYRQEL